MTSIETVLRDHTAGKLTTFDRMIFHGHLMGFFPKDAFTRFLWSQGAPLTGFGKYVETATSEVKAHMESLARDAGRPYVYLQSAHTVRSGESKEEMARAIAARDGITEGLVAVFAVLEPCWSMLVRGNRETCRKEVVRAKRKCLHYYVYRIDAEFGLMHVRLQSWFPLQIQVYVNGREWLARALDRKGIGYSRYYNSLPRIDDLAVAHALTEELGHREWCRVLDPLARMVNPLLERIETAGFGSYYWCLDQCEVATDVMFHDRGVLDAILFDLYDHSIRAFSSEDILRFLGKKLTPNFAGEVNTSYRRRPEGYRVKHTIKNNSIKMYDKASVLRIETTINNPGEFKVLKAIKHEDGRVSHRWSPMGKGVANAWRYLQIGTQANNRYLEALGSIQPKREAIDVLDSLCRSRTTDGKRYARLNPITAEDCALFAAVMFGAQLINGFRNHDLQARLYESPSDDPAIVRRRCARTCRLIAKLRGHHLIAKVQGSRLYRVTPQGFRVMAAALRYRSVDFPTNYQAA